MNHLEITSLSFSQYFTLKQFPEIQHHAQHSTFLKRGSLKERRDYLTTWKFLAVI